MPVAFEVARDLQAPLDVCLVRKLGVPGHEELAMGAIASGGVLVTNREVVEELGISEEQIRRVAERERQRLDLEDIQGGAAHLAASQRLVEIGLVHDPATGAVDDSNTVLHLGDGCGADQIGGFVRPRGVDGDEVGLGEQLLLARVLGAAFLGALRR